MLNVTSFITKQSHTNQGIGPVEDCLVMATTEALQPQLDAHLQWAIRAKSLREKLGGNLALPDLVSYHSCWTKEDSSQVLDDRC